MKSAIQHQFSLSSRSRLAGRLALAATCTLALSLGSALAAPKGGGKPGGGGGDDGGGSGAAPALVGSRAYKVHIFNPTAALSLSAPYGGFDLFDVDLYGIAAGVVVLPEGYAVGVLADAADGSMMDMNGPFAVALDAFDGAVDGSTSWRIAVAYQINAAGQVAVRLDHVASDDTWLAVADIDTSSLTPVKQVPKQLDYGHKIPDMNENGDLLYIEANGDGTVDVELWGNDPSGYSLGAAPITIPTALFVQLNGAREVVYSAGDWRRTDSYRVGLDGVTVELSAPKDGVDSTRFPKIAEDGTVYADTEAGKSDRRARRWNDTIGKWLALTDENSNLDAVSKAQAGEETEVALHLVGGTGPELQIYLQSANERLAIDVAEGDPGDLADWYALSREPYIRSISRPDPATGAGYLCGDFDDGSGIERAFILAPVVP